MIYHNLFDNFAASSFSPFHAWHGGMIEMIEKLKTCNYFHGDLSPHKFLIAYLAMASNLYREGEDTQKVPVTDQHAITMAHVSLPISSGNNLPPISVMGEYAFGTPIKPRDKSIIHEVLSRFVSENELDTVIDQIQRGGYKDFINSRNYGLVYAMCYATWAYSPYNLDKTWNRKMTPVALVPAENQVNEGPKL